MAVCNFFLGKGGVGKSTMSAVQALQKAAHGKQVVLISMDPAHNQADIFDRPLTGKPATIKPGLAVLQLDHSAWIKNYLQQIESKLKSSYQYLSALNLDHHLQIIRFSPGIEEYALLLAFDYYTRTYAQKDLLIFDMPPTALTLKFFNLPQLSRLWLEKLLQLRREILEKRNIITKIKLGRVESETDKILNNLKAQMSLYSAINERLHDPAQTKLKLVLNDDRLSRSETKLIVDRLREWKYSVDEWIVNNVQAGTKAADMDSPESQTHIYPRAAEPLIGLPALERYLAAMTGR